MFTCWASVSQCLDYSAMSRFLMLSDLDAKTRTGVAELRQLIAQLAAPPARATASLTTTAPTPENRAGSGRRTAVPITGLGQASRRSTAPNPLRQAGVARPLSPHGGGNRMTTGVSRLPMTAPKPRSNGPGRHSRVFAALGSSPEFGRLSLRH